MPPIQELIIAFFCVAALPLLAIISTLYFNRQDKQEEAKAKQVWNETPALRALIEYRDELADKRAKLTRRKEELRVKLTDKAYFPKESTYFNKYEVEYQELYFKQEKVNRELATLQAEIERITEKNNIRSGYPWRNFLEKTLDK